MEGIIPRVAPPVWQEGHSLQGLPDGAVALETRPEGDLPHPVPLPHPPLRLRVRQLVPQGAARRVAEAVQRHPRRLHVPLTELEILLQLVQHRPPTRVDAEMLERQLEVRDVWLHPPPLQHLPPHQRHEEH